MKSFRVLLFAVLAMLAVQAFAATPFDALRERFIEPPSNAGSVTLWWLNGKVTPDSIREQMLAIRDRSGFGGIAPLTMFRMKPATDPPYLSDAYFECYGTILDTAKELGLSVVFYDDCDFPSGTAGNRMREAYPDSLMKYLTRAVTTVEGPGLARLEMPEGRIMSLVARDLNTGARRAVTREGVRDAEGAVCWEAPAGRWEVQGFVCATAPDRRFVDVLDPEAVRQFIGLTYDQFANRFPEHFGTTVKLTFFDDLAVYHVPDSALWTPRFNEKFRERYGADPELDYPALWEDIGPGTASARARLLGFRNELFAAGYPGTIQQWCAERGMMGSGHPAGSYRPNPLQTAGDSMLFYRYSGTPLTDSIHYYQQGIDGFMVPASAAWNWDQPLLVSETYGNYHPANLNDGTMLYRAAMELYARGINAMLPHGTWWDAENVKTIPEISWRNPAMAETLPGYNRWVARCETLLRGGRHVTDLAVLYPIDDLAARFAFGAMPKTNGRVPIPGSDYYEIMRMLKGELRRDFTMLHPEALDTRCAVEGDELALQNAINHERYRALVLPACRTIRLSNLEKIKAFYDGGGRVVATSCLPEQSVEPGQDAAVRQLTEAMFGAGGRGVFVEHPNEKTLAAAFTGLGLVWDVTIENVPEIPRKLRGKADESEPWTKSGDWYGEGNRQFTYLHRERDGAQIYYFANSSDQTLTADVTLRGSLTPEVWDPHTGQTRPVQYTHATQDGQAVSRLKLELPAVHDLFIVAR